MSNEELLPCPFCGSTEDVEVDREVKTVECDIVCNCCRARACYYDWQHSRPVEDALKKKVKKLRKLLAKRDTYLAELKAPLRWRLFSEETPKEGQGILVLCSLRGAVYSQTWESDQIKYHKNANNYWMPCPKLTKEE